MIRGGGGSGGGGGSDCVLVGREFRGLRDALRCYTFRGRAPTRFD